MYLTYTLSTLCMHVLIIVTWLIRKYGPCTPECRVLHCITCLVMWVVTSCSSIGTFDGRPQSPHLVLHSHTPSATVQGLVKQQPAVYTDYGIKLKPLLYPSQLSSTEEVGPLWSCDQIFSHMYFGQLA